MALKLTSPAFRAGSPIPVEHTCDGPDRSPPLAWSGAPAKTRSFALVVDDPDAPAGTWVHWVLYRIPGGVTKLPEGVPGKERVRGIGIQGVNDFGRLGYGGPCPPAGRAHRYVFHLYALDVDPALPPRTTKAQVLKAIEGHVVAQAELVGRYQRT
jgi:Raf kinase inhibitor-like YbhB/YbcL family protein